MPVVVEQQLDVGPESPVVVCHGEFGPGAVSALMAALEGMPDGSTLVVDVSGVSTIDDEGLRALLGTALRLVEDRRLMTVLGAGPALRTILRSAGLHRWAALT